MLCDQLPQLQHSGPAPTEAPRVPGPVGMDPAGTSSERRAARGLRSPSSGSGSGRCGEGVAFPLSMTHHIEMSKITNSRQRLDVARTMASISHCRTLRAHKVLLRHQMLYAMHLAFGRPAFRLGPRTYSARAGLGPVQQPHTEAPPRPGAFPAGVRRAGRTGGHVQRAHSPTSRSAHARKLRGFYVDYADGVVPGEITEEETRQSVAGSPANVALGLLARSSIRLRSHSMLRSSASARPAMTTRGWRS